MPKQITIPADVFPEDQQDALTDAERKLREAIDILNWVGGAFTDLANTVPEQTAFRAENDTAAQRAWALHTDAQVLYTYFGQIIGHQARRVRA